MRVEPYGVGSIIHVVQRGIRGSDIVRDVADQHRFVRTAYYLNDTHTDPIWHKSVTKLPLFERPPHWPERKPLVHILSWTLLSNHFHFLLQEIDEGGATKFIQRLSGSVSMCFNKKYNESGRLFQSSYRSRTVSETAHFNYLAFYILVKNTLEMYPGGLASAVQDFDAAWRWASQYPFSSFRDAILGHLSPIVDDPDNLIASIIGSGDAYKQEARELLERYVVSRDDDLSSLMLEPW